MIVENIFDNKYVNYLSNKIGYDFKKILLFLIILIVFIYIYTIFFTKYGERKNKIKYLRKRADVFINTLKKYDNLVPIERKYFVNAIVSRFSSNKLKENNYYNALFNNETSYVLNKDEALKMCVMKDRNTLHENHTLEYVLIHELSHMGSIEVGHDLEFVDNFKWLLRFLADNGVYVPYDFKSNPVMYCGKVYIGVNQINESIIPY